MGYYTGSGVVSGGGSVASLTRFGPDVGGAYYVYQRVKSTVTQKSGVSLEAAQEENAETNMNFWTWPGGIVEPACRGTRKQVQYSRIGDSSLYVLNVTNEAIQVRGVQGRYDSGWLS